MKSNGFFTYILIIILINLSFCQSQNGEFEDCGDNILCPKDRGQCTNYSDEGKFCKCFSGYMDDPKESNYKCTYKQKTQLKAFLLELFLTYGAGHFYVKNYKYAIPKLIVFIFLYCLFIFLRIVTKAKEENKTANLIICINAIICFIGMITWQLIDVFKFGYNKYKDGNGIELYPM